MDTLVSGRSGSGKITGNGDARYHWPISVSQYLGISRYLLRNMSDSVRGHDAHDNVHRILSEANGMVAAGGTYLLSSSRITESFPSRPIAMGR